MELCTILLKEDVAPDARRIGEVLAPILGVTRVEAKMAVRRARGIFLEDVPEDGARRIAEALEADGVGVWCVRNSDLPPLAAPRRVVWAERSEPALRFRWSGDNEVLDLPWSQIAVVSVAAIAQPEWREIWGHIRFDHVSLLRNADLDAQSREIMRENLILRMQGPREPAAAAASRAPRDGPSIFEKLGGEYANKLKVLADVVSRSGDWWLRLPMDELAYGRDAAGPRFGDAWGFGYLFSDLLTRTDAATPLSLQFHDRADIRDLVLLQVEELNRYTAWHAYKKGLPCAASSSPSPAPPAPSTDAGSSTSSPAEDTSSTSP